MHDAGWAGRELEVKQLIAEAFELALQSMRHPDTAVILIDPEVGAPVARRARDSGWTMAISLEASGRRVLRLESDEWVRRILAEYRPRLGKVLIRHNVGDPAEDRRFQLAEVLRAQRLCEESGSEMMLELLVPPLDSDLDRVGGDRRAFDLDIRPDLTVKAIHEIREAGIAPSVWKIEGFSRREDYESVGEATAPGAKSQPRLLTLGRGADLPTVAEWLRMSVSVSGYAGFAVGRTLWQDPVLAALGNPAERTGRVTEIADRYRQLVQIMHQTQT